MAEQRCKAALARVLSRRGAGGNRGAVPRTLGMDVTGGAVQW
jgi:hypothetical protein